MAVRRLKREREDDAQLGKKEGNNDIERNKISST
jgi:hypothetical protein